VRQAAICTLQTAPHGGCDLHVDTAGNITGFDVRDDSYKSMTPQVASALKQWKFRVSYQGDHAIAADIPILLWSGPPSLSVKIPNAPFEDFKSMPPAGGRPKGSELGAGFIDYRPIFVL
jgi:hypothetical protein